MDPLKFKISFADIPPIELHFLSATLGVMNKFIVNLRNELDTAAANDPGLGGTDGYFDEHCEIMVGLGFVALQELIEFARAELNEQNLKLMIEILPNVPLGELINSAANYFKHRREWKFPATARIQASRENTKSTFLKVGIDVEDLSEFPLVTLLRKLSDKETPTFETVMPYINDWWKGLMKARKAKRTSKKK